MLLNKQEKLLKWSDSLFWLEKPLNVVNFCTLIRFHIKVF